MARKWLPWTLKLVLSGALIALVVGKVDVGEALRRARGVDGAMLIAALAMLWLQIPLATLRWLAVLRALAARLPFGRGFAIMYVGMFFNQALPSAVGGDAVRVWLTHRAGLGLGRAFNGVALERLAVVLGLVLLVAATEPFLIAKIGAFPGMWLFPLLALAGLAGLVVLCLLDRMPAPLRRWRLVRAAMALSGDARRVFLRPRHALGTMSLVLLGHLNIALVFWLLAVGLDVGVTLLECVVLTPPVILAMTLPISVGGWGVREGAMVATFSLVGVAAESALVLAVLYGLVTVAVNLPGGLVWLGAGRGAEAPGRVEA